MNLFLLGLVTGSLLTVASYLLRGAIAARAKSTLAEVERKISGK